MGIETGRHQQKLRLEGVERRPDFLLPGAEEHPITGARIEWHIDDVAMRPAFARAPRPRIERVLMSGGVEDLGVVLEAVLGAIPVMDVEVDDCNPPNASVTSRVETYRDVVQQAETHGLCMLGVMAGRPHDR